VWIEVRMNGTAVRAWSPGRAEADLDSSGARTA
jgi:hypothetical protein